MKGNKFSFTFNQAVKAKRETHYGIEYLVAPVIAVKAGVLNGELAPADELEASVDAWAGVPFVLDHPSDAEGRPISANDPDILAERGVGVVYFPRMDADAVKAEVWVEIAKAQRIGGDAIELVGRLERADPVEVSTAYWREVDDGAGEIDGKPYDGVQRFIRPDHLAAILHEEGACSWDDGCGCPRVNSAHGAAGGGLVANVMSSARRPTYKTTTEGAWSKPSLDQYLSAYPGDKPESNKVEDLPSAVKTWIASHTLLGDPKADDWRDLSFFAVVGTNGSLYAGALRAVLSGRGESAQIPEGARNSAQAMARSLLDKEFKTEKHNAVVSALRALAGALGINLSEEVSDMTKQEKIDAIVKAGFTGLTADDLAAMSDEALDRAHAKAVEFAAKDGKTDDADKGKTGQAGDDKGGESDDADKGKAGQSGDDKAANKQAAAGEATQAPCDDFVKELSAAVEKRGGLDKVFSEIDALAQNEAEKRKALVAELKSNAACAFTEAQLGKMELDELEALQRTLAPADYAGQGGGIVALGKDKKIVAYKMPALFSKPANDNGGQPDKAQ